MRWTIKEVSNEMPITNNNIKLYDMNEIITEAFEMRCKMNNCFCDVDKKLFTNKLSGKYSTYNNGTFFLKPVDDYKIIKQKYYENSTSNAHNIINNNILKLFYKYLYYPSNMS